MWFSSDIKDYAHDPLSVKSLLLSLQVLLLNVWSKDNAFLFQSSSNYTVNELFYFFLPCLLFKPNWIREQGLYSYAVCGSVNPSVINSEYTAWFQAHHMLMSWLVHTHYLTNRWLLSWHSPIFPSLETLSSVTETWSRCFWKTKLLY